MLLNMISSAANLVSAAMHLRCSIGDGLNDFEFTEFIKSRLAPSADELAWAERVLAAAEGASGAAVQLDGRMIDKPVIERARRTVQRAR